MDGVAERVMTVHGDLDLLVPARSLQAARPEVTEEDEVVGFLDAEGMAPLDWNGRWAVLEARREEPVSLTRSCGRRSRPGAR